MEVIGQVHMEMCGGECVVEYSAGETANGKCYKDPYAFRDNPDAVCYIPEYSFAEAENGRVSAESLECWTRKRIVEWCDGDEILAECVFNEIDWQSPSTFWEELMTY